MKIIKAAFIGAGFVGPVHMENIRRLGYVEVAAEKGLENTRNMTSIHGKAFYHTERSKGMVDPGAAAGVLFLKGFSEYIVSG